MNQRKLYITLRLTELRATVVAHRRMALLHLTNARSNWVVVVVRGAAVSTILCYNDVDCRCNAIHQSNADWDPSTLHPPQLALGIIPHVHARGALPRVHCFFIGSCRGVN